MIDRLALHRLLYCGLLLALTALIIFVRLVPLDVGTGGLPGPDLILCLFFVWMARRPDFVPVSLIVLVFLISDILFQRPPGLWTALVVLGLEFLRLREPGHRDLPILVEWGTAASVMVAILLAERLILGILMVEQISFGLAALRLVMTLLAYPVVALVSSQILGVRKLQPGEADAMRQHA